MTEAKKEGSSFIQRRPTLYLPLIGVGVFFVVSFLSAVIFVWQADWFGVGDLPSLPLYSACFAPALFWVLAILVGKTANRNSWVRLLIGTVATLALVYVLTMCVMLVLGGWFYAISYPLFLCWLLGALAAILIVEVVRDRKLALVASVVFVIGVFAAIALQQAANAPDPALLIVFEPGITQQQINEFHHTYICVSVEGRDGCSLAGSINTYASSSVEGAPAAYISFWKGTSAEEINRFRDIILTSPVVGGVYDPEENN